MECNKTLGPPIESLTQEEFHKRIKGMYQKPETKGATSVDCISISWSPRIIIRVKRKPKYVTAKEIQKLSKEFSKDYLEVKELFIKRKIEIKEEL